MPTELRPRRRLPSSVSDVIDSLLVSARWCLVVIAISLASLLLADLEIASWGVGQFEHGGLLAAAPLPSRAAP